MAITTESLFSKFKVSRHQIQTPDWSFVFLFSILVLFGLLMVFSSSFLFAQERTGNGFTFILKQLFFVAGSSVFLIFGATRSPSELKKSAYPLFIAGIIALICVQIPGLGVRSGGAKRWLNFGLFVLQPAEFMKVFSVLLVSYRLDRNFERLKTFKVGLIGSFTVLLPVFVLLLLQPDFGSTAVICLITLTLLFIAEVRFVHLALSVMSVVGAASILIFSSPYRLARISSFLNPWADPQGKGFQVIQSMLGFFNGGFLGSGLGNGKEKLFYLPEAHNDFIFAVVGEELGFLGVLFVVGLFIVFGFKGLSLGDRVFQNTGDRFLKFVSCGLGLLISLQAFTNMAVVLGLLPTKGLALPFISYGGSSMFANALAVGIMISISRVARTTFPNA